MAEVVRKARLRPCAGCRGQGIETMMRQQMGTLRPAFPNGSDMTLACAPLTLHKARCLDFCHYRGSAFCLLHRSNHERDCQAARASFRPSHAPIRSSLHLPTPVVVNAIVSASFVPATTTYKDRSHSHPTLSFDGGLHHCPSADAGRSWCNHLSAVRARYNGIQKTKAMLIQLKQLP